mmetsp:Transcript_99246/g.179230  ORF Transcript_99246/g.179230 Transcript_99246/m.179230 type:complete len:406 (+) Transcript_99246:60-1277(+)|eukprot:CAMPEP_0115117640 /NCGR_PEP_ID=MMETSP0227-20121206/44005_1 /TAXON_ID=89957 /ORGANISM="Polarella glacialis, Strain CCMP 1383" /LENGTH=405 /DNA_ID=CAMNT_0002518735 /DNA_START=44 /DNA_END=1261 /DNA_ORIENTATION=-
MAFPSEEAQVRRRRRAAPLALGAFGAAFGAARSTFTAEAGALQPLRPARIGSAVSQAIQSNSSVARPASTTPVFRCCSVGPAMAAVASFAALTLRRRIRLHRPHCRASNPDQSGAAVETRDVEEEYFFEEVSGDDPLVQELEERMREMNGDSSLTLDMVLNPGSIVNAERAVILLRAELKATPEEEVERRKELEDQIEAKQMKVVNEMRLVMTDSLKLEFLLQAIASVFIFASMCYGTWPLVPDLLWLDIRPEGVQLGLKLFGLWGIWLVTVPALRARKPGGPYGLGYEEKRALDLAFLVLPFVCLFTPFFSKDPTVTFWACLLFVAGLYLWSFNTPIAESSANGRRGAGSDLPEPLMWVLKALDFGTGSERGANGEDTSWQEQLAGYERAADELAEKKRLADAV